MYGSILSRVTVSPLHSRRAPMLAAESPLPSDERTPPVMKINFVLLYMTHSMDRERKKLVEVFGIVHPAHEFRRLRSRVPVAKTTTFGPMLNELCCSWSRNLFGVGCRAVGAARTRKWIYHQNRTTSETCRNNWSFCGSIHEEPFCKKLSVNTLPKALGLATASRTGTSHLNLQFTPCQNSVYLPVVL